MSLGWLASSLFRSGGVCWSLGASALALYIRLLFGTQERSESLLWLSSSFRGLLVRAPPQWRVTSLRRNDSFTQSFSLTRPLSFKAGVCDLPWLLGVTFALQVGLCTGLRYRTGERALPEPPSSPAGLSQRNEEKKHHPAAQLCLKGFLVSLFFSVQRSKHLRLEL